MPNSKTAEKRVRINKRKALENVRKKSALKTLLKKTRNAEITDPETAKGYTNKAYKAIDKAAAAGIIHKNTASRRKSRISKAIWKPFSA
ncbi:MAG: 30S ribosomal protein S20 [Oscillospiraceae bacterium]|nr:30S ribosomal protein S20 [Oscillospiraceae bacterium]